MNSQIIFSNSQPLPPPSRILLGSLLVGFCQVSIRAPFRCHILGYTTHKKGLVYKHPTVQIIVYFVKPNGSMRWYAWVVLNYPFILRKTKRWYEVVCMSSTKLPLLYFIPLMGGIRHRKRPLQFSH
jgi:hypothetical protein